MRRRLLVLFGVFLFVPVGNVLAESKISSLDDLQMILQSSNAPSSKLELLELLDEEFFASYVLVHRSGGLQEVSPEAPRVIGYHSSGMIVAFNGDSTATANALEVIQYDEANRKFEFAKIDFEDGRANLHLNPSLCKSCHSPSLHPNWFTYPLWPGVYDARDTTNPTSNVETTYFPGFLESHGAHPIYHRLKDLENYFRRSPSTTFNDYLNPKNKEFIAGELGRSEHFGVFKYALQGALRCVRDIEMFLPEELKEEWFPVSFVERQREISDAINNSFQRRFDRFVEINDGTPGSYPYTRPTNFLMQGHYRHQVAALSYLLDQQEFQSHRLFFGFSRSSFMTPWSSSLLSATLGIPSSGCRELSQKSLEALSGWRDMDRPYPILNQVE